MDGDRYSGKPLLRMLELYVLWAIDALDAADSVRLRRVTPKLVEIWGGDGSWHGAIASVMEFPPDMAASIRAIWELRRSAAAERHEPLTPQDFAEMFVDANFPVDPLD